MWVCSERRKGALSSPLFPQLTPVCFVWGRLRQASAAPVGLAKSARPPRPLRKAQVANGFPFGKSPRAQEMFRGFALSDYYFTCGQNTRPQALAARLPYVSLGSWMGFAKRKRGRGEAPKSEWTLFVRKYQKFLFSYIRKSELLVINSW